MCAAWGVGRVKCQRRCAARCHGGLQRFPEVNGDRRVARCVGIGDVRRDHLLPERQYGKRFLLEIVGRVATSDRTQVPGVVAGEGEMVLMTAPMRFDRAATVRPGVGIRAGYLNMSLACARGR